MLLTVTVENLMGYDNDSSMILQLSVQGETRPTRNV